MTASQSSNGTAPDHLREATKDAPIGGQAVLEGVMMRGISTWAVAVRKPSAEQLADGGPNSKEGAKGEIEVISEPLVSWTKRHRLLRLPLVRGVVALAESLKIGFRALGISGPKCTQSVKAEADPDGVIVESSEADNAHEVSCSALPST